MDVFRPTLVSLMIGLVSLLGQARSQRSALPTLDPALTSTLVGLPDPEPVTVTHPTTEFLGANNTEVHCQQGTTAVLYCQAKNVGENTVSWIRRSDYQLLTVGVQVYSTDQRFQLRHQPDQQDWQLHIRYVQPRDAGVYECQVSSHPPVSLYTLLHVLEARAEILGGPEKHMTASGPLRLVCVIRDSTQPPAYVFWYHDNTMINYQDTREMQVQTQGGLSVLFFRNVMPHDSGNYTCAPANARAAHVALHVLQGGETPAAIHSCSPEGVVSSSLLLLLLLLQIAGRHLVLPTNGTWT